MNNLSFVELFEFLVIILILFLLKRTVKITALEDKELTLQNFYSVKSLLEEARDKSDNTEDKLEYSKTLELMRKVERTFNV